VIPSYIAYATPVSSPENVELQRPIRLDTLHLSPVEIKEAKIPEHIDALWKEKPSWVIRMQHLLFKGILPRSQPSFKYAK
jgi:hypothetical protein